MSKGNKQASSPNWPSKVPGNKSGGGRDNNTSKPKPASPKEKKN